MIRKAILSLAAALSFIVPASAQKCYTDEQHQLELKQHPELAQIEAKMEQSIAQYLQRAEIKKLLKGTGIDSDTVMVHIPMVVHVIHNYGAEYVSDDQIYSMVARMNTYYNKRNADTAAVIAPFKKYIGNAHITFHLATKDPAGKPSHGITRRYTFLSNGGDESAKLDIWPPDTYYNLWLESKIGRGVAGGIVLAYATFPSTGSSNPYSDGVIARADNISGAALLDNTIEHETGHYLNLFHTWNSSGQGAGVACGDDAVDDTPPTKGHYSTCPLYDTICASGYVRNGIDYPDTTNVQNIMDYSSCTVMFTAGQAMRMRAALASNIGGRSNLWSAANLIKTGALAARPDLAPVADFSPDKVFVCANSQAPITFTNRSWQDTIATASWSFPGATPATSTAINTVNNVVFGTPGWVNVSLTVTGNNGSGSSTITKEHVVYAADPTPVNPHDFYQEFNPGTYDKWPIFNYYGGDHKWEVVNNAGYFDQTSIRFANFDTRQYASFSNTTLSTDGTFSDFFTPGYDLSSNQFSGAAYLNFMSAGAFRTTNPAYMNDTLQIYYSNNCGSNWATLAVLTKGQIANNGYVTGNYTPASYTEWAGQSFTLPTAARTGDTYFRFRFKSGSDNGSVSGFPYGTGNNFYLDRINITGSPLGITPAELEARGGMILAPNPTNGSAVITLKGGDNSLAQVTVTDITGKVVYRTEARLTLSNTQVEIPASSISVKGMYLVGVVTNGKAQTQKLVVY